MIRETESGRVEGSCENGICRFLGIPYAAPPVGALRFQAPQPPSEWQGVRDATLPGPSAPHKIGPFPQIDVAGLVGDGGQRGNDYLTLNVWTPEQAAGRPVMVFIHGGGFVIGSKDAPVHDGTAFARDDIVSVSINYRLGIDGFLPIPGVPTNLGLRDMLAALHWVQRNIAGFGGDPANVTVFGESAGAMAIADLLASPLAAGLFRRAIVQSGHGRMVRELAIARRLVDRLAKLLKIAPTKDEFENIGFDAAWAAMEKASKPVSGIDLRDSAGHEPVYGISRFIPVVGDDVLPKPPIEALAAGAGRTVDLLIGTNAEEMNLYFVPTRVRRWIPRLVARWLIGKSHPDARAVLAAYDGKGKGAGHVMTEALTDLVFRWPARQFAAAHQGRTHVYEFDWQSPACNGELGACHGIEMPFVFDTLHTASGPRGFAGENPPQELADRVHRIWVNYAIDGSLPWPEFDADHRCVHLLAANRTINEPPMPAAELIP